MWKAHVKDDEKVDLTACLTHLETSKVSPKLSAALMASETGLHFVARRPQ